MKRLFTLVILGCLATAAFASSTKVKKHPGTGIREQYMVILQDGIESQDVERVVLSIADLYKVRPLTVWKYAPHGFLCVGREKDIDDMARDERVKFVEQDHMMHSLPELSGTQWTWWNGEYLWHLDRIDELSYANRDSLHNMCTEGRNVAAYVIDSGVDPDHPQFEVPTRVREQFDFSPNRVTNPQDPNYISSETSRDVTNACTTGYTEDQLPAYRLRWHGTAVGSVLAGTQVGVAKPVVVSLKVQDCLDGRILAGDVVDAINFIGGPNNPYRWHPGVINFSLAIKAWDNQIDQRSVVSQAANDIVALTNFPFFSAAGNYSFDACQFATNDRARTYSQAGSVFTVGGTSVSGIPGDNNDYRFQHWDGSLQRIGRDSGSNAGRCISIYAPAVSIYAARHALYQRDGVPMQYDRADGTSFSAPIVAGIAARYIERQINQGSPRPTAQQVYDFLLNQAQTFVYNVQTPAYWYCAEYINEAVAYRSNPPQNCPQGNWGQNGNGTAPYYFPSVGNDSGARMVYWDEAYPAAQCP